MGPTVAEVTGELSVMVAGERDPQHGAGYCHALSSVIRHSHPQSQSEAKVHSGGYFLSWLSLHCGIHCQGGILCPTVASYAERAVIFQ